MKLKNLQQVEGAVDRKAKVIDAGIHFMRSVQGEIKRKRDELIPYAIGVSATVATIILGFFASPTLLIPGLSVGLIASLMSVVHDVMSIQKSYRVTENQQEWIAGLIVDALVTEARFSDHFQQFGAYYGFTEKVQDREEFLKQFKRFMKEKIQARGKAHFLRRSLLEKLKSFHEKDLTQDFQFKLRDEFNQIFDQLVVNESNKEQLSQVRPIWQLLKQIKGDSRLQEILDDCSYRFRKQQENFVRKMQAVIIGEERAF